MLNKVEKVNVSVILTNEIGLLEQQYKATHMTNTKEQNDRLLERIRLITVAREKINML